jgi:1A family penicillin-binding protein
MNNQLLYILARRRARKARNNGSGNLALKLIGGFLLLSLTLTFALSLSLIGGAAGIYAYYSSTLPDPKTIEHIATGSFESTKIYDRTGKYLLYEIVDPFAGYRTWVPLEKIPLHLRQATIAIEDKNFYKNPGVDLYGLARAIWYNLRGYPIQGASTIPMQLVKNTIIPPEERYKKTITRKIKEAILALEISRRYPKDQILEWYLNTIYYGNLAYGVEAASQVYFGKHVWELNLAESAMLAAIPQFPALNPIDNFEEARKRQHLVLDAMVRQGYITPEQAVEAKYYTPIKIRPLREKTGIIAPHFVLYVRKLLEEEFGPDLVYRGGLKVYTTLDMDFQKLAEEEARKQIEALRNDPKIEKKPSNAAVVVMRNQTGEILAMVGSIDYWNEEIDGEINMAISPRQPGSAFKPFTYVTALAQGFTPATMLLDVPMCFPDPPNPPYCPVNYDRKYHGPQSLRNALARSYNIPAVWTLSKVGVKNVINVAHRMGITTLNADHYGLSLTLGGGEVTLLDMVFAYTVFANNGTMMGEPVPPEKRLPGYRELQPVAILKVEDKNGRVLKQFKGPESRPILSPQLAYLITHILSDNKARIAAFGPNNMLQISRPAAVKTGTTNDWRDAWAIGYTPQICVGVWVGNTNNEPMERIPGARGAAPIWHNIMERAYNEGLVERLVSPDPVEKDFQRPPGLVEVEVCAVSGLLPNPHCPHRVKEIFIQGTEPTTYCNIHQAFLVNKVNGKLATAYTPPELVEERVYEIYPPEAADWVRMAGIPQPPTVYDDSYGPAPQGGDVAILNPLPYSYVHGVVPIIGNALSPNFMLYRLEFGKGLNPSAWTQIGGDHYNQVNNGVLEYWDTSGLEGLYTLQLTVVDHDQTLKRSIIQVTVDNTPPKVEIIHPEDGDVYVMEQDEWVNIQARATDNISMDRVEFYLDNTKIGESSVPPYSFKWTIKMSDTIPIPGQVITALIPITNPDGSVVWQEMVVAESFAEGNGVKLVFSNGMTIISDTVGYTETHVIHVVAYDSAGNSTQSQQIRISVVHEKKEKKAMLPSSEIWVKGPETAWQSSSRSWKRRS